MTTDERQAAGGRLPAIPPADRRATSDAEKRALRMELVRALTRRADIAFMHGIYAAEPQADRLFPRDLRTAFTLRMNEVRE